MLQALDAKEVELLRKLLISYEQGGKVYLATWSGTFDKDHLPRFVGASGTDPLGNFFLNGLPVESKRVSDSGAEPDDSERCS